MLKLFKKNILLGLFLVGIQTFSQDSIKDNSWSFKVEPNVMFPHIKGKAGILNYPNVNVDQSSSDFFKHMKLAGMVTFEASNKDWVIGADIIYASLGANVKKAPLVINGDLSTKQFSIELSLLRKIAPWLEAGVSANLMNVKSGFDVHFINPQNGQPLHLKRNLSRTWVDPMIVARTRNYEGKKFLYNLTAEMGGFGIGSKFAWQLEGLAGYQVSDLFYVMGGYQVISVDYGSNKSNFRYDMKNFGPMIKLGFNLDHLKK